MKSNRKGQKQVLNEAKGIAKEIECSYPGTVVEVSLKTQEGGDAYLWITASATLVDEIRTFASELATRLWERDDIVVIPRMDAYSIIGNP